MPMCSITYAINSTSNLKKQRHDFVSGVPAPFARGIDRVKWTFNITFTITIKQGSGAILTLFLP